MWTFKPGYLGVTIAVIALLGGVLLGSLLNVSSHDQSTTKYEYVSDISGLFDVSNEPQYIDFNPVTNYTGYTNATTDINDPSGVLFDHSTISNNYRMITKLGTTEAGPSGTVNRYSTYPTPTIEGLNTYYADISGYYSAYNNYTYAYEFKYTTLYDMLRTHFGPLSQYSKIELNINWDSSSMYNRAWISYGTMYSGGEYRFNYPQTSGGVMCSKYVVDMSDLTVMGYNSENRPWYSIPHSIYEFYICYGQGTTRTYVSGSSSYGTCDLSLNYTSVVTYAPTYAYMVPSSGVTTSTASTQTIWDNDTATTNYDNRVIDILIGPTFNNGAWVPFANSVMVGITLNDSTDPLTVYFIRSTGANFVSVSTTGPSEGAEIGDFKAFMYRLEKTDTGVNIAVYGVTSFTDYLNVQVGAVPLFTTSKTGDYSTDSLLFASVTGGASWSIYNTKVFMDTYGAVLVDPSINLANYWPDMSSYRYAFQSFALYGDSVTINGVTYPVTNERITINDRQYKLNNFYLSFSEQGDTSITFKDVNKTVDLGPTVDKTVSFSGNWGFTTGLYEGQIDVKKVYDWSIKLLGDNLNTIVLISMALVAVLVLACRWLGMSFKMTDKIVLGGAGLFMLLLLVV